MSTGADLKAREGDIPSDNMTQEQSFKKGKVTRGTLGMREVGDTTP
jgi:hypothetical protein